MKRPIKNKAQLKSRKLYLTTQPRLRPVMAPRIATSDRTKPARQSEPLEAVPHAPISDRISLIEVAAPSVVPDAASIPPPPEAAPVIAAEVQEKTVAPIAVAEPDERDEAEAEQLVPPEALAAAQSQAPPAIRRFRHSLWVPALIATAVIAAAYRYPAPGKLWGEPATSPAFVRAAIPVGTPETAAAGVSADASQPLAAAPPETTVALVTVPPVAGVSDVSGGEIEAQDADFLPRTRACSKTDVATFAHMSTPPASTSFGAALATAAETQIGDFVVYNDDYRNMHYPGGDIAALYGVCSDVIIRTYRALGIDLQRLVHEARVGSGDTSIDHRRTETLRRFFARRSANIAVTDYAEDYLPGDVVTYDRPQNRHGQSHIAVVSSLIGPSGRRMIVHNRGWGPQLEDALFVDEITGHYRFNGVMTPELAEKEAAKPSRRSSHLRSVIVRRAAILRSVGRNHGQKPSPKM